ncbi:hypothetical protein J2X19_000088 [Rhodoferax ferrireducens]|uniref:Uncharacterized protein n=1 Tax=Rhodoferax ferrireducens TaxID=192843 RepID=A0ABU2C265_9BURK|nr:hypothetical protein [Rhodoferax ferrireducens]MDR7375430.1 hypothetical protein [Rhodoferax ferrireducens]
MSLIELLLAMFWRWELSDFRASIALSVQNMVAISSANPDQKTH